MKFSKEERRETRTYMMSLRLTPEQADTLQQIADALDVAGGRAEVIRRAIDYWIENDRAVRAALRQRRTDK